MPRTVEVRSPRLVPVRSTVTLPSFPDRTFEGIIFDWDGTAVPDRFADASNVRERIEALCAAGAEVFIVSGTHLGNVDGQLRARPGGPGHLHLCLNRGSEVFHVDGDGPRLVWRRSATPQEDEALDLAATLVVQRLAQKGLRAEIVSKRLNRRKIDLIPEPEWVDPPKARIDELLCAVIERLDRHGIPNLGEIVALAAQSAHDAGLDDPRITSDVKHVEIGLTDKSDSALWALRDLAARGIGPGLVLFAGDEFAPIGGACGSDSLMLVPGAQRATTVSVGVEPEGTPQGVTHIGGGPQMFLDLLDDQLERRRTGRVPDVDEDPAWMIVVDDTDVLRRHLNESLLTIADGRYGVRGAREEDGPSTEPLVVAAGIFERGEGTKRLIRAPLWSGLSIANTDAKQDLRTLDLRTGVVRREGRYATSLRTIRFASIAHPGIMVMRAEGASSMVSAGPSLLPPDKEELEIHRDGPVEWTQVRSNLGGGITVATSTGEQDIGSLRQIERIAAYASSPVSPPPFEAARDRLVEARRQGFERLLAEQRSAWSARWEDASISIDGDPELELAARFAIFHLLACVADEGEAAVGARGVSGSAYGGHVFWDSDVFCLPMLAATNPGAARAMLEYRLRRLPAAREAATRRHMKGARFPWESADDGADVTITSAHTPKGIVLIRTGQREEHITSDVAWAACHYASWTGDDEFLRAEGRPLITETARYWSSRVRFDTEGQAHIYGVIGPDEYHEIVDDNAYTNVMARWNLRRAADLIEAEDGGSDETQEWRHIADALVDGWDPQTNRYEQFAGFSKLEPLLIAGIADRPVAADVLLGRDRVAGAQVIKQADVLMLHHLVPDEVVAGSLESNLEFYEPRTAHGSSLSPAIHAALFARAGKIEEALMLLRIASRIDLDDLTGTTAGGLHVAALGGLWQAIAFGFAGLHVVGDALAIDPKLPEQWRALEMRMRVRGRRVGIRLTHGEIRIDSDGSLPLILPDGGRAIVSSTGATFVQAGDQWKEHVS